MLDAYLYAGKRTPFGRHAGSLAKVRPDDMLAGAIKSVVENNPIAPNTIDGRDNPAGRAKNRRVDITVEAREEVLR